MATNRQCEYYKALCDDLYVEPIEDFEDIPNEEASILILELIEMKEGG